ncbi:MAG: hypothetical protein QMC96_05610 [Methanomicrobiales archaeon]|nr:hypothetical protein [Methanomicrobiales archaeon]
MKPRLAILILLLAALGGIAAAADTAAAAQASPDGQITVTDSSVSPEVLMRGDTGTVTVRIMNSGTDNVVISRARLYSNDLAVLNAHTYDAVGTIGPGNTLQFTFAVKANSPDGIYYPMFYLDFRDGGSLRYYLPVKVESTDLRISVVDAPDTFPANSKDTVTLSIGNPRENSVNGVTITPRGAGITSTQSSIFVGTLEPDAQKNVSFDIAASQNTELEFDVSYRNGINEHHITLTLPVEVGKRTVAPEPVVNNIEVTQSGGVYTIEGDITNAGLKEAYSILVSVGSPARGVDPYPVYVVGALEPDDFSSFEVTCTAPGASSVPLLIRYKDENGKAFEETVTVSLSNPGSFAGNVSGTAMMRSGSANQGMRSPGMFGSFGSGFSRIPLLEIAIVAIGVVAVVVAWRTGAVGRIQKRLRR